MLRHNKHHWQISMTLTRRKFLNKAATGALLTSSASSLSAAMPDASRASGAIQAAGASSRVAKGRRQVSPIGVQLYTLRSAMGVDAAATLAAVAAAGYEEVETAGTGNLDAQEFARALRQAGLSAPAAHVPIELIADDPEAAIKMADLLGCLFVVIPWLPLEMRTAEGYGRLINALNQFGETCAQEGLQVCYHNHDFEFDEVDGEVAFDRLLRECDRDLVKFEMDLYWVSHAGVDPGPILAADPERFPLCHVKDRAPDGKIIDVGKGTLDFPSLFAAGDFRHYFIEHDHPPDALTTILTSIQAVRAMKF